MGKTLVQQPPNSHLCVEVPHEITMGKHGQHTSAGFRLQRTVRAPSSSTWSLMVHPEPAHTHRLATQSAIAFWRLLSLSACQRSCTAKVLLSGTIIWSCVL